MGYQVLARKWRPRRFQDMVGQEPVLRMLANALDQNRLHHAYLLTGTRGVGKTTLGRLLAKCLNCETGVTSNPCGTCSHCQAIDAGQYLDLYEVDAASRTKVEDTRDLLDNVLYAPTQGRYKVYLIDEVHMLSNHSFNALLKTLEEPPEHVKFILATTDPKRLPITILSRCLQFHLKRITPEQIEQHLEHICQSEAVQHESAALSRLAKAADGSMRDALSLLDQAIAYGNGHVTSNDVNTMLGCVAQDDVLPLLTALATHDGKAVFTAVNTLAERVPDFRQILEELISALHQIALHQILPDTLSLEPNMQSLAQQFTPEEIQLYYQICLLGRRDIDLTPTPQQGFEMTLLRMLAFTPDLSVKQSTPCAAPSETVAKVKTPITKRQPTATPAPTSTVVPAGVDWRALLPKLELSGMAYALASNCTLLEMTENKIVLALSANHQPMFNPKLQERIAESLSRCLNKPMQLDIKVTTDDINTPAKQQLQDQKQQLDTATSTMLQDPLIKQLIDMYDATVEVSVLT